MYRVHFSLKVICLMMGNTGYFDEHNKAQEMTRETLCVVVHLKVVFSELMDVIFIVF